MGFFEGTNARIYVTVSALFCTDICFIRLGFKLSLSINSCLCCCSVYVLSLSIDISAYLTCPVAVA